jgi:peptidoglycan hydrolase CwlO-like protein
MNSEAEATRQQLNEVRESQAKLADEKKHLEALLHANETENRQLKEHIPKYSS